ncbi:hypothetical protein INT48_008695 [Thamnidium elegans]|uniref:Uncharacterized protein n=1 Tax=Thamnidium elegans TaxID=101142 RepID=A0A8H7SI34_9FUNG|nr:hypothetical protein INT48_008695 [Thamnidium elegans]
MVRRSRPLEWDDNTIRIFLKCMIDSDFYNRYIKLGNLNKSSLWKELHATFISHPEVVAYASSARGVVVGIMMSGLGDPPVQSRDPHYDQLKQITFDDPSFWPETITRSSPDQDNVASLSAMYTHQNDGVSYTRTFIETPASVRDFLEERFRTPSIPSTPAALVTPAPAATTTTEAEVSPPAVPEMQPMGISGDESPHTTNTNEQLPIFFSELKKIIGITTEYMAQTLESRRLDRLSHERIADNEILSREKIAKMDREVCMETVRLEIEHHERIVELSRDTINLSSDTINLLSVASTSPTSSSAIIFDSFK